MFLLSQVFLILRERQLVHVLALILLKGSPSTLVKSDDSGKDDSVISVNWRISLKYLYVITKNLIQLYFIHYRHVIKTGIRMEIFLSLENLQKIILAAAYMIFIKLWKCVQVSCSKNIVDNNYCNEIIVFCLHNKNIEFLRTYLTLFSLIYRRYFLSWLNCFWNKKFFFRYLLSMRFLLGKKICNKFSDSIFEKNVCLLIKFKFIYNF